MRFNLFSYKKEKSRMTEYVGFLSFYKKRLKKDKKNVICCLTEEGAGSTYPLAFTDTLNGSLESPLVGV